MQTVQGETLAERVASVQVRAYAVCGKCEATSQAFRIAILECGCIQVRCFACGEVWEAPHREQGQNTEGDKAMVEVGDVGADLVSTPKGEENWFKRKMIDIEQYEAIKRATRNWR